DWDLGLDCDAWEGDRRPGGRVTRDARRVNGRPPRERDKTDRTGCTDPVPLSPEPLTFLLPSQRSEYRFTAVHEGRERDRSTLVVDLASAGRESHAAPARDEP